MLIRLLLIRPDLVYSVKISFPLSGHLPRRERSDYVKLSGLNFVACVIVRGIDLHGCPVSEFLYCRDGLRNVCTADVIEEDPIRRAGSQDGENVIGGEVAKLTDEGIAVIGPYGFREIRCIGPPKISAEHHSLALTFERKSIGWIWQTVGGGDCPHGNILVRIDGAVCDGFQADAILMEDLVGCQNVCFERIDTLLFGKKYIEMGIGIMPAANTAQCRKTKRVIAVHVGSENRTNPVKILLKPSHLIQYRRAAIDQINAIAAFQHDRAAISGEGGIPAFAGSEKCNFHKNTPVTVLKRSEEMQDIHVFDHLAAVRAGEAFGEMLSVIGRIGEQDTVLITEFL